MWKGILSRRVQHSRRKWEPPSEAQAKFFGVVASSTRDSISYMPTHGTKPVVRSANRMIPADLPTDGEPSVPPVWKVSLLRKLLAVSRAAGRDAPVSQLLAIASLPECAT